MSAAPRRVRIDIAYDGTEFAGWQIQPGQRTVQGVLEEALGRLHGGRPVRVRGAGRTDSGVHARQQVADGEVVTSMSDDELARALDGVLPEDLRPLEVRTVEPSFHARRAALRRSYRYRLDRSRHGNPLLRRFSCHRPGPLDRERLEAALSRLPGRRDWSGFAGAGGRVKSPVRTLAEASYVEESPGEGHFSFAADGFLQYMVRNLVGTLLEVGAGRFEVGRIDAVLESGDRRLAGPTASPRGLVLWSVEYPGEREGE